MNPSSGASSATPLAIQHVSRDHTTRITMRGRVDASNHAVFRAALRAIDHTSTSQVELGLSQLEACDIGAVFELVAFASEVRDHGRQVALIDANLWVLAMLTLLDVAGAITMPTLTADPPAAWLTTDASPTQTSALHQLLTALDHQVEAAPAHPAHADAPNNESQNGSWRS